MIEKSRRMTSTGSRKHYAGSNGRLQYDDNMPMIIRYFEFWGVIDADVLPLYQFDGIKDIGPYTFEYFE